MRMSRLSQHVANVMACVQLKGLISDEGKAEQLLCTLADFLLEAVPVIR